jgi:aldehyde:ferredoxin oxidoreductase
MKGYVGKILFVNLSSGETRVETVPDSVYETVLAGVGLGAYELYQHIPAGADPLGPENMLGFVSGLLSGTPGFLTGRWLVVCKSPLTGGWGDANCGGTFATAIKQCGYDGIFVNGIASEPVYLYVDQKKVEIRPAGHVWGLDAVDAEQVLQTENRKSKDPSVAIIGPAGEKLSLISGVCNESGRIAARSGVGAVMGSKRLKAVVLAGIRQIGCDDPDTMKRFSKQLAARVRKQNVPWVIRGGFSALLGQLLSRMKKTAPIDGFMTVMMLKKWGTSMNNGMAATSGDMPIKNWSGSVVDYKASYYRHLNPDHILRRETKKYHCNSCVIGCGGIVDIRNVGQGEFTHTHKPEYETCAAFGGLVMNKDLDAILYINELLNRAGMDCISAGGTVAFAIECFENGIITPEMTGGLELHWGNADAIVKLVKMMIARQGIGDLLADGVKAAAAKLGAGSSAFAVHAGGQEPGMHDSRMDPLLGLHFSADPTPGRHTIGSGQYYDLLHLWELVSWAPPSLSHLKDEDYIASDQAGIKSVACSCYKELLDGAGGCYYAMLMGVNNWNLFEYLNASTGWGKTPDEYMQVGKRIQTLRQMFNIKQGIDPWQFKMHDRMAGNPPLKAGPLKGRTVPIEDLMRVHWKTFGWNEATGVPTVDTVATLGIDSLPMEKV